MKSKPTLETLFSHRSIRQFTSQPIEESVLTTLIDAGRHASTSNHLQCVSIIRITDPTIRTGIQEASGMQYISECAEFLLFCIDFHKHKLLNPDAQLDWTEVSLIGAVDTGIMAQNVLIAAEAVGIGGVYIGALRNNIQQVAELVKLPQYCIPVVGLCLGYPAQDPAPKPRLPQHLICYENSYPELSTKDFANYNAELTAYYHQRGKVNFGWVESICKTLNQPVRPHILPFFQKQGLLKR